MCTSPLSLLQIRLTAEKSEVWMQRGNFFYSSVKSKQIKKQVYPFARVITVNGPQLARIALFVGREQILLI